MKTQENMAHSKKKTKVAKIVSEETQASEVYDKNFRKAILNILKELKEYMDKELQLTLEQCGA